jgi:DNA-binding NtrC family response regulator
MAHVLIIDDDENDRLLLGARLQSLGHTYDELDNGRFAINTIAAQTYDAVALDLIMPEAEGAETLQSIHRHYPELPVVVMSGLGREYLPMMSHLGAFAVAEKSSDFSAIVALLTEALSK